VHESVGSPIPPIPSCGSDLYIAGRPCVDFVWTPSNDTQAQVSSGLWVLGGGGAHVTQYLYMQGMVVCLGCLGGGGLPMADLCGLCVDTQQRLTGTGGWASVCFESVSVC
jgi:hypothetical protein